MGLNQTMRLMLGMMSLVFISPCIGQTQGNSDIAVIDARTPAEPPRPLPFAIGGISPDGHALSANNQFLTRDGKPWFPIVGEFHYARYRNDQWEQELLKIKAGGVQVISTYIFWIYHEEIEGQFDWTGQRDLRRFVDLCAKHGLYVWIRIGPWDHGEVRNGGLPDWLLKKTATRQNDPVYLKFVARFFDAIGDQLKGRFWKDGGPIIGVQLENEYTARGPGKGEEHIVKLRELALQAGLDAPFYTVTAWDGAIIPSRDVLPVFSGYADGFWWRSVDDLPPSANYFFTPIRCEENVADDLSSKHPEIDAVDFRYPFLTAEMGGGMEVSYHRRPLVTADDVASMELVKLGSGVTMYGYYMFHGGTNPDGRLTTLQESQATGYPNDLPVKSYDFQAPIGESGRENPSFRSLKLLHLFLTDFGSQLAPMTPYFPERSPTDKRDVATPRVSARMQGAQGFIFINNYQRSYPLPEHKNFQLQLKLSSGTITIPRKPIAIPSGAYTIWAVNLEMGGFLLRYATAQLVCKVTNPETYFFFAEPGVRTEFAFEDKIENTIEAPSARVTRADGWVYLDNVRPGTQAAIHLHNKAGADTQIVVLSREQALNAWKLTLAGRERLILSSAELYVDGNQLTTLADDPSQLSASFFPAIEGVPGGFRKQGADGIFSVYAAEVHPVVLTATVEKMRVPGPDPPWKMSRDVPLVPDESAFQSAACWRIRLPDLKPGIDVFLKIKYQGDVARLYAGDKLLDDNFYNGSVWSVRLGADVMKEHEKSLELRILPLRQSAPIYFPRSARPALPSGAQVADLQEVTLQPEYRAVMDVEP
jgi:beta-galactosidase